MRELVDGGVVAGVLIGAAGPDLHLEVGGGGEAGGADQVIVDSRVMSGWRLVAAEPGAVVSVPVTEVGAVQGGLF
ncbi:hypothetical protein U9R90_18100 [Streptomyces sp. E11-3]|uniref:hypothetical protein n=1 Tax=Streptomyces sp. E11-3 TaxID=3110112 RepID=UPI00398159D4